MTSNLHGKNHLPLPRGPHSVGFVDYGDQNVLVRIYYPSTEAVAENHQRWPLWAEDDYVSGLLTFIKAMSHRWPSWAPRGEYEHFDSIRRLSQWIPQTGFPTLFRLLNGRVHVPIVANAKLNQEAKWPLVVFSHGLGCARFTYSQICYDIASFGYIVIAPEHRDGSACLSFHFDKNGKKWSIPHRRIEWSDEEYFVRNRQVRERCHEAVESLKLAFTLNEGEILSNFCGDSDFLKQFKDSMDLSHPVMCGHSFGGATTLMALRADRRFKLGIVLDGWLFPIRDESSLAEEIKDIPLLFINTESFLNEENLRKMQTFSSEQNQAERQSLYIKGSVHQNHIDAPFVMKGAKLRRMLGMHSSTSPELVMTLNNKLMVQFIQRSQTGQSLQEIDADLRENDELLRTGFGVEHCDLKEPGHP